jgi:hypothetical protein
MNPIIAQPEMNPQGDAEQPPVDAQIDVEADILPARGCNR